MSTLKSSSSSICLLSCLISSVKNNQKYEFSMDFLTIWLIPLIAVRIFTCSYQGQHKKEYPPFASFVQIQSKGKNILMQMLCISICMKNTQKHKPLILSVVESFSSKIPARREQTHMIERGFLCH